MTIRAADGNLHYALFRLLLFQGAGNSPSRSKFRELVWLADKRLER